MIPGIFFDINPSHRRNLFNSPCHHFVRLSFGPPIQDLDKGMHAPAAALFHHSTNISTRARCYRKCLKEGKENRHAGLWTQLQKEP